MYQGPIEAHCYEQSQRRPAVDTLPLAGGWWQTISGLAIVLIAVPMLLGRLLLSLLWCDLCRVVRLGRVVGECVAAAQQQKS